MQYFNKLNIPKEATNAFKNIVEEGDSLKSDFYDNFEITNDENDKESKSKILELMSNYSNKWDEILSMLKGLGLTYKKDLQKDGKKGVVLGIRRIEY